ncbi:MAG TPA: TIGR03118 family protein [Edaphobacter sp.]|nr:TIGR03118 family protein [Edaphobacter sp.]
MIGNERPIEIESISVIQTETRDAARISIDRFFPSTSGGEIAAGESSRRRTKGRNALFALLVGGISAIASAQTGNSYQVTNLISDGSVTASVTDPNLINPWGIGIGSTVWISGQKSGLEIVTTATGTEKFDVNIPPASGNTLGQPTGVIFSGAAKGFALPVGAAPTFLFATKDGTISGWNAVLGMNGSTAQIVVNNGANNASYTGLTLLNNSTGTYLLASNFGQASDIEVYNTSFKQDKLAGNFTDPKLPAGYSPLSVHVIGNQVFVAYALRSTTTTNGVTAFRQTVGAGDGILDVFDLNGNFVATAVSGGNLNAPWGVAIAPSTFGVFGGDLLVGNFGDGVINVYNPNTYAFLGQLIDSTGKAISNPSLWEIVFGTSNATPPGTGDPDTLFFTSGLTGAAHGLFATITSTNNTNASPTFGFSASTSTSTVADGSSIPATVSVVPTNGFSGDVALSCSGPVGISCTFSPSSLSLSATAVSTANVEIKTTGSMAKVRNPFLNNGAAGIVVAVLFPFGSILAFSRKRVGNRKLHILGAFVFFFMTAGLVVGCSSSNSLPSTSMSTPTPTGMQQVTIKASSGNITQTATINLTVQ